MHRQSNDLSVTFCYQPTGRILAVQANSKMPNLHDVAIVVNNLKYNVITRGHCLWCHRRYV